MSPSLNWIAKEQYEQVERIWPTPPDQDPLQRQILALTEEVGEIARAALKRSHAERSPTSRHKGLTVEEWTWELREEIGQAIGVLLGLGHLEGVDLDTIVASTLTALRERPSILDAAHSSPEGQRGEP